MDQNLNNTFKVMNNYSTNATCKGKGGKENTYENISPILVGEESPDPYNFVEE